MVYWVGYFAVLILGAIFFLGILKLLYQNRQSTAKKGIIGVNVTLSLMTLFLTFVAVEFYFKVFFAQTDNYTFTLSAQNWYEKYWHPINSFGYRDREWKLEDTIGKTKLMVVGDSFVAGTGIDNYEQRFPDQLAKLLGPDYVVLNVASPGWSTEHEIRGIVEYPYKPDILILSYFINDIEQTAYNRGVERPKFAERPSGVLGFFVDNSYAFNFLYWRWYRLTRPPQDPTYMEWISSLYQDSDLWWRHRQELLTIIEGAASEEISLLVVVFPDLTSVEESRLITQPVIDLFQEYEIPVLDVGDLLAGRDPTETMVSAIDAHPNENINLEVAEHLYQMIQKCEETGCKVANIQ